MYSNVNCTFMGRFYNYCNLKRGLKILCTPCTAASIFTNITSRNTQLLCPADWIPIFLTKSHHLNAFDKGHWAQDNSGNSLHILAHTKKTKSNIVLVSLDTENILHCVKLGNITWFDIDRFNRASKMDILIVFCTSSQY